MSTPEKAYVELFQLGQAALIVLMPTGIVYTNQANGHGCAEPHAEGFLVPIDVDSPVAAPERSTCRQLMKRFESGIGAVTPNHADYIDAMLAESTFTRGIRVDRTRLPPPWSTAGDVSMESWIYVTLEDILRDASVHTFLFEANARTTIFTWPNSD